MRLCARLPKKPGRCPGFICQSAPKVPKNDVFDTFAAYGRVIYMRRAILRSFKKTTENGLWPFSWAR